MAAVTWKNIAPMNPSGILNSMNQSAQQIGEAGTGIQEAISGYVDDRQKRETDAFVADLMNAGSQEERDAMISAANQSWLNLDQVNKTNYELGAPDRERKAFEEQLAAEQLSEFARLKEENRLKKDYWDHQVLNPKPTASSGSGGKSSSSKTNAFDPSTNDPTNSDGYFKRYLSGENTLGFGQGFEDNNRADYAEWTSDFLNYKAPSGKSILGTITNANGSTEPEITAWHVNELVNQRLLRFEDRSLFEGALPGGTPPGDNFTFEGLDGQKYYFSDVKDNRKGATEALTDLIYEKLIGKPSPNKQLKIAYHKEFIKNNPQFDNPDEGFKIFERIYDDIKDKSDQNQMALFDKLSNNEAEKLKESLLIGKSGFNSNVPKDENYEQQVANARTEYRDLSRENLEKRYRKLSNGVNLSSKDQARLEALSLMLFADGNK
jgi:hypothetical protein